MLIGQRQSNTCSYTHVRNLLYGPIIEYIEFICEGTTPEWTKSLGLNHAATLYDMIGIVGSFGDTLEMEMFINFIQKTLCRCLEVHVPTKLVKRVVWVLVPNWLALPWQLRLIEVSLLRYQSCLWCSSQRRHCASMFDRTS